MVVLAVASIVAVVVVGMLSETVGVAAMMMVQRNWTAVAALKAIKIEIPRLVQASRWQLGKIL
jgi:hypothetical protein